MSFKKKRGFCKLGMFTFADLFAGVGGMRLAFEATGGECVLSSEIDEKALLTYRANFSPSSSHIFVNDVQELEVRDFPAQQLDVLVAGFPCQPYSIAGLRKGLEDDRGGSVFRSLVNLIRDVRPRSFLLENVKGIRSHDNGRTFDFILDELEKGGYHLRHETLNSMLHANVPQNRERVFIVGFLDQAQATSFSWPEETELTASIHDFLDYDVDAEFYYDERFEIYPRLKESISRQDTFYQWRRQYVRENKSQVCPTLTANMGSGGHNVPLLRDNKGIRKLTPRETANFQGFPTSFVLPKIANSHLYHQFGNSVTVPLIERIAKAIVEQLVGLQR